MRSPDTGVMSRLKFFGLRQKLVVVQGFVECPPQGDDPFRGNAGRRGERPRHHLSRESDLEDLPTFVGLYEVHNQRRIGQIRMPVE